ncbi:hypothetical protein BDV93DRAFT_549462 [Ceratobasidium sp. AG-I]|nr:hypothetical protein BDV93DRAFT_549462 [Ceratobasidium sp. AG-I]
MAHVNHAIAQAPRASSAAGTHTPRPTPPSGWLLMALRIILGLYSVIYGLHQPTVILAESTSLPDAIPVRIVVTVIYGAPRVQPTVDTPLLRSLLGNPNVHPAEDDDNQ